MTNKRILTLALILTAMVAPVFAKPPISGTPVKVYRVGAPPKVLYLGTVVVSVHGYGKTIQKARAHAMSLLQQERRKKERSLSPGYSIRWSGITSKKFYLYWMTGGYWYVFLIQDGRVIYTR